ncbi:helix-turn-helix transcriptional regulator [Candidatus Uhrbacteria bacterium]|nr:helix-turn-helix transcriptional regulator [Candidatus Uhrbacteria bacterium]
MKTAKQMERHFKGIANHWRLQVLLLVAEQNKITLEGIVDTLGGNVKTISEHTRRLVQAGLLDKDYRGRNVVHSLSPYGRTICQFIITFQHS